MPLNKKQVQPLARELQSARTEHKITIQMYEAQEIITDILKERAERAEAELKDAREALGKVRAYTTEYLKTHYSMPMKELRAIARKGQEGGGR